MSEPKDDTPEPAETPPERAGRERAPGSYYYDDGIGYKIYTPGDDDEQPDGEPPRPRSDTSHE